METYSENNKIIVYCICVIIKNEIFFFYNKENLIISVLNFLVNFVKDKKIEIYIHNLNFDGILIITSLSKNHILYDLIANRANLYSIKIFYCNKVISLKCSYKIIPLSLRKLGEIENFEKYYFPYKFISGATLDYVGKVPPEKYWEGADFKKFIKNYNKKVYSVKDEALLYCKNDVILTQKVLSNIFKIIDSECHEIRRKGLSSPSISHKIFYKYYNIYKIEENIKIEHESYIRSSYFGGRCEVFGNLFDNEYIKYYDFSGMYAQCMLENFHCGEYHYEKACSFDKPGFYNITYDSNMFLPILPSHYNNKLFFLNGKNTGTFWFEEIKMFIENGGEVLEINNALLYNKFEPVFKDFTKKFMSIRDKDGYFKIFAKLMINGLYGSMALRHKEEVQYITFSEEEFCNIYKNTNVENFYRIESCYILIIKNDYKSKVFFKESKYLAKKIIKRNVSYASAIASKARIKLYKALLSTINDGGRLIYCDTDSVFAAYDKEDKREKTKDFKWLDFFSDGVFIAPKTYGLKRDYDTIKIKGVSCGDISFEDLKEKFYLNQDLFFENQLIFKKADFDLKQLYLNKHIFIDKYDKRLFSKNKKETEPLSVTSLYG